MDNNQYFQFEEGTDFPFYKEKNFFNKKMGIPIVISIIVFMFLIVGPIRFENNQEQLILFLVTIIPTLYITIGLKDVFIKKPRLNDAKLVIMCLVYSLLLIFIITAIFVMTGTMDYMAQTSNIPPLDGILSSILEFIQIIGEEFFRVFIFLITLHLIFKYTNNRKLSIVAGVFFALLLFGLMHINSYSNLLYSIVYIGFGSFFELYPYLKTKNLLLSIAVHYLFNLLVVLIHAIA